MHLEVPDILLPDIGNQSSCFKGFGTPSLREERIIPALQQKLVDDFFLIFRMEIWREFFPDRQ